MPPPVRGRGCDAQGRRGGPERRTTLDQAHQLQPTLQSELAPTVLHVRPPSAGLSSQTAPSVGGRTPSYPFSKSVGSSTRRAEFARGRPRVARDAQRAVAKGEPEVVEEAARGERRGRRPEQPA